PPVQIGRITALACSPDSRAIVVLTGPFLRVCDVATGKVRDPVDTLQRECSALALSPKGDKLATGGVSAVQLWPFGAMKNPITLKGHTGAVPSLAFSADGQHLVSTGQDGWIFLWDVATS